MIKYFQIKKRKNGRCSEIYYREKANSHAKPTIERYIKKNQSIVITGQANSGKTRQLMKFVDNAKLLWPRKKVIFFVATSPISAWVDNKLFADFALEQKKIYKGMKQYEKITLMRKFCEQKRPIIIIDNAHKLTGRKLEIIKPCLFKNQRIFTTSAVNRLHPSIRDVLIYKVEVFNFGTKTAFDATNVVIALFIVLLLVSGMTELAMMTAILGMIAKGRLGSKNNE